MQLQHGFAQQELLQQRPGLILGSSRSRSGGGGGGGGGGVDSGSVGSGVGGVGGGGGGGGGDNYDPRATPPNDLSVLPQRLFRTLAMATGPHGVARGGVTSNGALKYLLFYPISATLLLQKFPSAGKKY